MISTSTPTDTGEPGLQALIAKHNITMTTQYLGPNAIDNDENQWLVTLRRGDGRSWVSRFYGTTEEFRAALKAAESTAMPANAEILDLMYTDSQFAVPEFEEFCELYYYDMEHTPTAWDEMFHKYVLAQSEGFEQFMEGIDLPEK